MPLMATSAVVFVDDHRPDLETFAPVLAGLLGLSAIDARLRIRKGRGIFLEKLDGATARRVADALTERGWTAEVVPDDAVPRFARPSRLFQVDCRPDAFRYKRSMTEPYRDISWDSIRLVHAGVVATPQYRDFAGSKTFQLLPTLARIEDPEARAQLKRAMARKALRREGGAPVELPAEGRPLPDDALAGLARDQTDAYLDLFVVGHPGFLRADRRQVSLDYLAGGNSGGIHSFESFKRLAADVVSRAPQARVTPLTRRLLDGEPLPSLVFDDTAEHERYAAWFCLRNGIAPPAGGEPPLRESTPPCPPSPEATACARCGTTVARGADRCGYCKAPLRPRRRRLFWRILVPLVLLWTLAAAVVLIIQEQARRAEAIDRVRHHVFRPGTGMPAMTVDEAIRLDLRGLRRRKPAGWGAARRAPGLYQVDFNILREGDDALGLQADHIRFLVNLESGEVSPLNPEAARYLPPGERPETPAPP